MIEVEAPDGSVVEFPDGTSREVMQSAMQRRFAQPGPADMPVPPIPPPPNTAGRAFMQGVTDPVQGGAQLLVNALPSGMVDSVNRATQAVNDMPVIGPVTRALGMVPASREQINQGTARREESYQAGRGAAGQTGNIDWMRGAGNVAASIPAAIALPTGGSLLGSAVAGAATGAGMSALQPVDGNGAAYWDEKKSQAETGGALGGITGPLGFLVGRALAPNISQNVRTLQGEGVTMTPGQIMGGMTQRLESGAAGLPFLGDPIAAAQRRSLESFNRAAGNRVLQPLGEAVEPTAPVGREMIAGLQQRVSDAYETILPQARPFGPDQQFAQDISQVGSQFLTPQSRQLFTDYVRDRIVSRFQGGPIDGRTYQTIRSDLGQQATDFLRSTVAADKEIGRSFLGLQRAMDDLLARTNPSIAPQLAQTNEAFAALQRVQAAGASIGAGEGVFTPAQLQAAVRGADPSARRGAFARGEARMQDLSEAAKAVLPNTVPDSGTGFRNALMATGTGAMAGVLPPSLAAGLAGTAAIYSPMGQSMLARALLAQRSAPVRAAGNALTYSGGAVASPLAASLLVGSPPRPPQRP